ncbi:unnamed protein product [Rotaria sordida]|uniref:Uncharacterized protein n=1 Tax=Rotaria sordida TaxID=392033 RepID=A0A815RM00_9BILA|nr:unnamed protein product [Rotaria sordida]CAF1477627.1 unnamed protein product [Rotaria sordida]CAF4006856.1 unnamed protein product [Rotaria sordida]CAF4033690.1 unnamed protein product [Rotaria sordida]
MDINFAFTADVSSLSKYPDEEEELISPGVSFTVQGVELDEDTKKHQIYLDIVQRFTKKDVQQPTTLTQNKNDDRDEELFEQYCLDAYDSYDEDDDIRHDLLNPRTPAYWRLNRYNHDGNERH